VARRRRELSSDVCGKWVMPGGANPPDQRTTRGVPLAAEATHVTGHAVAIPRVLVSPA
jgi:hypothetical protein